MSARMQAKRLPKPAETEPPSPNELSDYHRQRLVKATELVSQLMANAECWGDYDTLNDLNAVNRLLWQMRWEGGAMAAGDVRE